MKREYVLHTLDNLTEIAKRYFELDRVDDAIQTLNTATTILYTYEDNRVKDNDYTERFDKILCLADDIIHREKSRFESKLSVKFTCFQ